MFKRAVLLLLCCFVFNINAGEALPLKLSSSTSSKLLDSLLTNITSESQKGDVPGESLSPFIPALSFRHEDVHIPITAKLAISFFRNITQDGNSFPLKGGITNAANYTNSLWELSSGYIVAVNVGQYNHTYSKLNPVYVGADGQQKVLFPIMDGDKLSRSRFMSKDFWSGSFTQDKEFEMLDASGMHYIFNRTLTVGDSVVDRHRYHYMRYYLTEKHDNQGNWIKYHYKKNTLALDSITASDGSELIISYKKTPVDSKITALLPESVSYNGNVLVHYDYHLARTCEERGCSGKIAYLDKVTFSDGRILSYNYLRPNLIDSISYSDGSKVEYTHKKYKRYDKSLYHGTVVTHKTIQLADGTKVGTAYNGIEKVAHKPSGYYINRVVRSDDKTVVYRYRMPDYSRIWAAGLLVDKVTYKIGHSGGNYRVEAISYKWEHIKKSVQQEHGRGGWDDDTYNSHDEGTFIPYLTRKIITRYNQGGEDKFTTYYEDFDDYLHPQTIREVGPNGAQRTITQTYAANEDKHILDLLSTLSIDGQQVLKRDYDALGQMVYENKFGTGTYYSYDAQGNLASTTDSLGRVTQYLNYSHGQPSEIIRADNSSTRQSINPDGTIASQTDAAGFTTHFSYDAQGQLTGEQRPLGYAKDITRDYNHQISETQSQGNLQITTKKNYLGLPLAVVTTDLNTGESKQVDYDYDAAFRETFRSYPYQDVSNKKLGVYKSFDEIGRRTQSCYPNNNSHCTKYEYLAGDKVRVTSPEGRIQTTSYQSYGRPNQNIIKIEQEGAVTEIKRNVLGSVTRITFNGLSRDYEYDAKEQLISETNPESGTTRYHYDAVGNLIETHLADSTVLTSTYDALNREIKRSAADRGDITTAYDVRGNLIKKANDTLSWHFDYDANNNRVKERANFNGKTITRAFDYDGLDNLSSITLPSGEAVTLSPNALGQATQVGNYLSDIRYTPVGQLASIKRANGVNTAYGYDEVLSPQSQNDDLVQLNYRYDDERNLTHYIDKLNPGNSLVLGYDKLDRLVSADGPWGQGTFSYDRQNNLSSQRFNHRVLNYEFDGKNQLAKVTGSSAYTLDYDSRGNVRAYAHNLNNIGLRYNLDNQLVASNEASYSYDGFGHRFETIKGQAHGITLYDESGQVFYEQSPDGTLSESLYLDDNRVVANHYKDNQKQTAYYHSDVLGNVLAASDVSGQLLWRKLYEPYGKELLAPKTSDSDAQGFSGKRLDTSTGLLDFGARVYHPELGRFLSLDPAAVQADKPFSFNRYIYANNNPYKYKDPDGRFAFLIPAIAMAAKAIDWGMTAYDAYNAYQAEGMAGVGKEMAMAGATSAIPGSKIIGKIGGKFAKTAAKENTEFYSDYNKARNAALDWLELSGFKAEKKTIGKFGSNRNKAIGMQTKDGKKGFRVEHDERSGAHINVWSGKTKGPHIRFSGNQEYVNNIIKRFNN